ncbi:hypothetical protein EDD18DRAFT_1358301 [Armillaria luteobubalina]|uniref:Uncharacterized protein n=1 Tax=Armillaria luteobubalina TaxID=153913 RepID=A0AA39PYB0_9AGAR|nr:hypothetical protein EDD18DRAFT_1358301 [Armillaria luteobubalina]
MLLYLSLFCFCFATSIGLHFDEITANATVDTPFTLTWHLDPGEEPDELHLEQILNTRQPDQEQPISFSFPKNGTLNGTVPVIFTAPGYYLIQAFRGNNGSLGGPLGIITLSEPDPGTKPPSTMASTSSASIALSGTTTSYTSPAVSIFSTSSNYSSTDSSPSSPFEPTGSLSTDSIST